VATGKLAGQVLEVVVPLHRLSEAGGDPDGERIAADTSEVLAEQARCSHHVACGGGGDHFDVMAFPVVTTRPWSSTAGPVAGG
jgi:hypothetical protein